MTGIPYYIVGERRSTATSNPFYYVSRAQPEPVVEIDPENEVERTAWGASAKVEALLGFADFTSISAVNGFVQRPSHRRYRRI